MIKKIINLFMDILTLRIDKIINALNDWRKYSDERSRIKAKSFEQERYDYFNSLNKLQMIPKDCVDAFDHLNHRKRKD